MARKKSLNDITSQRSRLVNKLATRMQQSRMLMHYNSTNSPLYKQALKTYLSAKEKMDRVEKSADKYSRNIKQDRMIYDPTRQYAQSRYIQGRVNG